MNFFLKIITEMKHKIKKTLTENPWTSTNVSKDTSQWLLSPSLRITVLYFAGVVLKVEIEQ